MEREKVDKAALGYDYKGETERHQSQKGGAALRRGSSVQNPRLTRMCVCSDYASGFGGRYGVQADRMDKVSLITRSKIRDILNRNIKVGHQGALNIYVRFYFD